MQACIYERYGAAEVVRLAEVAKPGIKANEVLVRVRATSVTTADWRFRSATFPGVFWLPGRLMLGLLRPKKAILGMDFSGVVEAAGPSVTRFRVGDEIFGAVSWQRLGAHAEYLAVSESDAIIHKPAFLTHQQAVAIPFGANAALAFLQDFAALRPGQRVLIVGASGGVGSWAVQLARHFGAEVTGVCSARNVELVRGLGAHHVIDYTSGPLSRNGETYDLIFDTIGVTTFAACKDALSEKGVYLPLTNGLREIVQALFTSRSSGKKVKFGFSQNTRQGLTTIVGLIESGALKPVIDSIYPMAQIVEAHRRVEGRHKRGSVIVTVDDPRISPDAISRDLEIYANQT
jgi:NADPH:quinone reductase-like Zn-dependent oxidoreductase